jgi:hypothetical protein
VDLPHAPGSHKDLASKALHKLVGPRVISSYRVDGWGRAAFEPAMLVSLLVCAYARGERSLRAIERKCVKDVAYRVIAAHQKPDHATIARFRVRHEDALADLFSEVLSCPPNPHPVPEQPEGKINTTDPDSRNAKTPRSYTQGYNAQAV